jgi:ABC-type glucose/galactose transport system permease subunit
MDFDSEFWIYIGLIAIAAVYFLWNKSRINRNKTARKNKTFRQRYQDRKKKS